MTTKAPFSFIFNGIEFLLKDSGISSSAGYIDHPMIRDNHTK